MTNINLVISPVQDRCQDKQYQKWLNSSVMDPRLIIIKHTYK